MELKQPKFRTVKLNTLFKKHRNMIANTLTMQYRIQFKRMETQRMLNNVSKVNLLRVLGVY